MATTGGGLVVDALCAAGVRHLFSLSGNQILPIYDATIGRDLAIIHTRHEAAAVHMADGWGRLTEEPGVALVTAGPGHLNALSALYGALMAESPVVLLSGHAPLAQQGRGAFQEVDQAGAARPVTKAAWVARDAARLGEDIRAALDVAKRGRPGPVHVSLPGDLLEARIETLGVAAPPAGVPAPPEAAAPHEDSLVAVLDMLAGARRPLIIGGPAMGRARRWQAVEAFSQLTGIPALVMESPRGVNDPWLHGAAARLAEVDAALLLGKPLDFSLRFGAAPAFAAGCRFLTIGLDAVSTAASRVSLALAGDPETAMKRLVEAARGRAWAHHEWGETVRAARRWNPPGWEALRRSAARPIHPLCVAAALQPWLDRGATLVCDGGEFGQWIQAGVEAPVRLINGLSGSIGSAIPMACGALLARPGHPVIAVVGDGTFGFHGFELDTAVRHGLPVVVVVGNDARWNAEHQLQLQQYGAERTVGCELLPSRYDKLAEALGAQGEHVERPEDLEGALGRAIASGRAACINLMIEGAAAPTYTAAGGSH